MGFMEHKVCNLEYDIRLIYHLALVIFTWRDPLHSDCVSYNQFFFNLQYKVDENLPNVSESTFVQLLSL